MPNCVKVTVMGDTRNTIMNNINILLPFKDVQSHAIFYDFLNFHCVLSFVFSAFQISTSKWREEEETCTGWES